MSSPQVKVDIVADSTKFQSGMSKAGKSAESFGTHLKGTFSAIGSSLMNSSFGQSLGPLAGAMSGVGAAFTAMHEGGKHVGTMMVGVGGAALAAASGLAAFGSADQAAQNQLATAYQNIGKNIGDFQGKIDGTVQSFTKYGYTADQVKNSLAALTTSTRDPARALNLMGTAANLAASQHISLEQAATKVTQILQGKGTKTLTLYGITVVKAATATSILSKEGIKSATQAQKNTAANQALALNTELYRKRLEEVTKLTKGQANAAADTFSGRLKQLRAEVMNQVAAFATKYGPAIQAASAGMMLMGGAVDAGKSVIGLFTKGSEAAATATDVLSGSQDVAAASSGVLAAGTDTAAVAEDGLAVSATAADTALLPIILTVGAIVAGIALLGLAVYELVAHWSAVWNAMKMVVGKVWNFIDGVFIHPLMSFFSKIVDFIKSHWQLLLAILTGPIGLAVLFIKDHVGQIVGFFSAIPGQIQAFFVSIWHGIESVAGWIDNTIANLVGSVINFFSSIPGKVAGFFTDLWNGAKNVVNEIYNFFANLPGRILGVIQGAAGKIGSAFLKMIPGGGVIGGALNAIGLASGGIVSKPTLAVVGEAGPEAVIPLGQFGPSVAAIAAGGSVKGLPAGGGRASASSDGYTGDIVLKIDGQEFARVSWPHLRAHALRSTKRNARTVGLT